MIRRATAQDYEAIKSLKQVLGIQREKLRDQQYKFLLQKKGFLLFPDLEKSDFERDLKKFFLVYEINNVVAGYIVIGTEQEMKEESSAYWLNENFKSTYFAHPHADINVIVVSPDANHKGVGTALLKAVEQEIRKQNIPYLFSLVVLSPLTNVPSLLFHEKHGFDRIAITSYPELFGIKNYQSILYGKKL